MMRAEKRLARWRVGKGGVLLFLGVAVASAVFVLALSLAWRIGALASARGSAEKRPEARTLAITELPAELPDGGSIRIDWRTMVPLGGGGLVVGRASADSAAVDSAVVAVALDSRGVPRVQGRIADEDCGVAESLAVGAKSAIVLCASMHRLEFIGVEVDGAQLNASRLIATRLIGGALSWSASFMKAFGAATDAHHFWVVPSGRHEWAIGAGEGLNTPVFSKLTGVNWISDVAALSASEAVLATVGGGSVKLVVVSPSGHVERSVVVATGSSEDVAGSRPKVHVNSSGTRITVVWLSRERKLFFEPFVPDESILLVREFSSALAPLGAPEPLSQDRFVSDFFLEETSRGGIVTWEPGVREPWNVAGLMRLNSSSGHGRWHGSAFRVPAGRLPLSLVETDGGLLALLPSDESTDDRYRAALLDLRALVGD